MKILNRRSQEKGMGSRAARLGAIILTTAALAGRPGSTGAAEPGLSIRFEPTVFMVEERGKLFQTMLLKAGPGLIGEFIVEAEGKSGVKETGVKLGPETGPSRVLVPACDAESCSVNITLKDRDQRTLIQKTLDLTRQRRWKVYLSPFSHIDVGFTNSQRKILAQNLENLRVALDLVAETEDYPESSRFKFFTEVSWPLFEFLYSDSTTAGEKQRMLAKLRKGRVEIGAFLISHQDKFMPAEALFRSTDQALKINRDFGVPVKTGCLNDLMDLLSIVRPLHEAGVPYFLGGPNTSRYLAPPLFRLKPPAGQESLLVWLPPNLNGYGENFDFAMRPELPLAHASIAEIESRLGAYLKSLEIHGSPPAIVRDHFDFYGATWPYPYDIYFLPFYPPHAVDNGPQDITASDLARAWNQRWAWPRLLVATPSEFFAEVEARFQEEVPVIRGELPGFWGEQVFLAFAQADPEKEALQREFERNAAFYETARALAVFRDIPCPDLSASIAEGYKLLTLNNDHNPGPVPFGHTSYTKEDVAEWKRTRREWINEASNLGRDSFHQGLAIMGPSDPGAADPRELATALDVGQAVVLENRFYRVEVDKASGGVISLLDKQLGRELAAADGPYLLNQYLVVARGENAAMRGNLFSRPGFKKVKVEIISEGPDLASARISGPLNRHPDQVRVITRFFKDTFGIPVPGFLVRGLTRVLKVRLGPVNEVLQVIELKAGQKAVFFTQSFKMDRDQAIDHVFAYPLNVPQERPLLIEGPYSPYRFSPGPPLGDGDLVPAARMMDADFPGINDFTQPFGWIYGLPPDAVFRTYLLARGDGFGIAFSCKDSGVVFPGPLDKDPVRGPFGGEFYHLAVGWTAYGKAFLGAPRQGEHVFRSALTSFPARDPREARTRAAQFGQDFAGSGAISRAVDSSNPAVIPVSIRPTGDKSLLLRLYESSGAGGQAKITLKGLDSVASAARARSDGLLLEGGKLGVSGNWFAINLGPGEVATVRVDLR